MNIFSPISNNGNCCVEMDISALLKQQRLGNPKNIILGHLNINSLRNKIESVKEIFNNNIDILLLSETKLDESFPSNMFSMEGFRMFRKDRNQTGGGLIFYVNENIACRVIDLNITDIEVIAIEVIFKNIRWILLGLYKPPSTNDKVFLEQLNKALNKATEKYDCFILVGDFNMTISCYKSKTNPSCIDLILTNCKGKFMKSCTYETGVSDFHKLVTTIMKFHYSRSNKRTMFYRDYKNLDTDDFNSTLKDRLGSLEELNYKHFQLCFLKLLNEQAPIKKKYLRGNTQSFMTKALRKALMNRSRRRNIYNQHNTTENWHRFKKQRNFCVNLLKKAKKVSMHGNNIDKIELSNKAFVLLFTSVKKHLNLILSQQHFSWVPMITLMFKIFGYQKNNYLCLWMWTTFYQQQVKIC